MSTATPSQGASTPPHAGPVLGREDGTRLNDLLQELLARIGEVVSTRDRLQALLDAVVSITSDLDLPAVLERIVLAACRLVDAEYGALGVIDGQGRKLDQFITCGLTDEQRAWIGDPPHGRGVLGVLIDDPRPIRLETLGLDPRSHGFPANHPPMNSFLGVPVRTRGKVFGNLYLTEKRGRSAFTQDDEDIVVALAAAAGVAIENARLYEQSQRRRRWLEAAGEITGVLLGSVDRQQALQMVASRARRLMSAELAAILIPDSTGELAVEAVAGPDDDAAPATSALPGRSGKEAHETPAAGRLYLIDGKADTSGTADTTGKAHPAATPDSPDPDSTNPDGRGVAGGAGDLGVGDLGVHSPPSPWLDLELAEVVARTGEPMILAEGRVSRTGGSDPAVRGLGSMLLAPLAGASRTGVILVGWPNGQDPPLDDDALPLLKSFADQAGMALQRVQAQDDRSQLAVYEDRDRIARDLHDLVIQRLFATGLSLQSLRRHVGDAAEVRLDTAVGDLDQTIREIRGTIFRLNERGTGADFRSEVYRLVAEMEVALGFAPRLTMSGPVGTAVSQHVRPAVLAALREALANVARHASASSVDIELAVGRDVVLRVLDDGVGLGTSTRRSGLANLRERAEQLGGTLEVGETSSGGTALEWVVPA